MQSIDYNHRSLTAHTQRNETRTGTRSPFSSNCITSERLLSEARGTCAGPYYDHSPSVGHGNDVTRRDAPGRRAGMMAVGAEDDSEGGFENCDARSWSAPAAAASRAGVDQNQRRTHPRGPRAGPSESRTRAPQGMQIARTYGCPARASPVGKQWGRGC